MKRVNELQGLDNGNGRVSILIADPSPLSAKRLSTVLSENERVATVSYARNRTGLIQEVHALRPQVLLVDLMILKVPQTLESLRMASPGSRIIALVESESSAVNVSDLEIDGKVAKQGFGVDSVERVLGGKYAF